MGTGRNKRIRKFGKGGGRHSKDRRKHIWNKSKRTAIAKNLHIQLVKCGGKRDLKYRVLLRNKQHSIDLDCNKIVNLEQLQNHISEITLHTAMCDKGRKLALIGLPPVKLITEISVDNLASVIVAQCKGCHLKFNLETSKNITMPDGTYRKEINVRAVWGTMVTGGGAASLNETLGTMNLNQIKQTTFSKIEDEIGKWWESELENVMKDAGRQEREIAIAEGNFHDGIPYITVVCDGGWSKRGHRHSYNALGGVAVIIGAKTGKLLHLGVRNKFCYVCTRAEGRHEQPKKHECFKNWNESSQSMESDIIVEGFLHAEKQHGLRYIKMVGDGDSAVYANIQEQVPVWGRSVKKIECANHTCKCLRSRLEQLVIDNPDYKGKNKLTKYMRIRIVSAVRCSIKLADRTSPNCIKNLQHDIKNSVYHVFGYHANCGSFCKASAGVSEIENVDNSCEGDDIENADFVGSVMEQQASYWSDGMSSSALDDARLGSKVSYNGKEHGKIIQDVSVFLNRIAEKADRLIGCTTSNLAECWMSIRTKFDGGKMYNRCNRGSWHSRCYGGGLRMNLGPEWSPMVFKRKTGVNPGSHFYDLYVERHKKLNQNRLCKSKQSFKERRWKRKLSRERQSNTKKAKMAYGPKAIDSVPDVSQMEIVASMKKYYSDHIQVSEQRRIAIQACTVQQSSSQFWQQERKHRLTASDFGCVVKKRDSTSCIGMVKKKLYSTFRGNKSTRYGLQQEENSILEYKLNMCKQGHIVTISSSGLVISSEHPYLGASPDGIVSVLQNGKVIDKGLIEIKQVLTTHTDMTIHTAAGDPKIKNFCLKKEHATLKLNHNHNFYYQIQGQLNVCGFQWCDLVLRSAVQGDIFILRLHRDVKFWDSVMLPKLKSFYFNCLLPEITSPRYKKTGSVRDNLSLVS